MAKIPKFCPECGTELGGKPVCEKCGFDTKVDTKMSEKKDSGSKSTWDSLEPIVTVVGKYAWIYALVVGIIHVILGLVYILVWWRSTGTGIWWLINAGVLIAAALLWIKPKFSNPCGEKNWEALLADVLVLGNVQIPWMLIVGVLLAIFSTGYGSLFVLVPALLIIFLGPRDYDWKVK
jgi:hypothetical protein